jgi:hypothetical protein
MAIVVFLMSSIYGATFHAIGRTTRKRPVGRRWSVTISVIADVINDIKKITGPKGFAFLSLNDNERNCR